MPNLVKHGRATGHSDGSHSQSAGKKAAPAPTHAQRAYLRRGLNQPGGKLPLFDENGLKINARTIRSCIDNGWSEPWFPNPHKPDWQVCKLTPRGYALLREDGAKDQ